MATPIKLFALVKKQSVASDAPIIQIVRTFESKGRAELDLELLNEADPDGVYDVIAIRHID